MPLLPTLSCQLWSNVVPMLELQYSNIGFALACQYWYHIGPNYRFTRKQTFLLSGIKYVHVSFSVSFWSFLVSFRSFSVSFQSFSVIFGVFLVLFGVFLILFGVYSYPWLMAETVTETGTEEFKWDYILSIHSILRLDLIQKQIYARILD